jgi:hypothetical protein
LDKQSSKAKVSLFYGRVVQLDRISDFGSEG